MGLHRSNMPSGVNRWTLGMGAGVLLPSHPPSLPGAGAGGVNTTGEPPPSEKLVRHDLSPLPQQKCVKAGLMTRKNRRGKHF